LYRAGCGEINVLQIIRQVLGNIKLQRLIVQL